jgi:hypothetical protein
LQPYSLVAGQDRTAPSPEEPTAGQACLRIELSEPPPGAAEPRGVYLPAPNLTIGQEYEIRAMVRGESGQAQLAVGPSSLVGLADVRAEVTLDGGWKALAVTYEPWTHQNFVFVTFAAGGTYGLDNLAMVPR